MEEKLTHFEGSEIVISAIAEIKTLTDRVNRHSTQQRDNFEKLFAKLDEFQREHHKEQKEILERIHSLELKSIRGDHELNAKIIGWTGFIGSLTGFLSALAYQVFRK